MDANPFPEGAAPVEADYEAAEEVSLEQLLAEGRTRPTFSGSVAVPLDDIEELGAAELVDAPGAVAVLEQERGQPAAGTGGRVAELEAQVASLEKNLQAKQNALESILRELDDLRQRLSGIISS